MSARRNPTRKTTTYPLYKNGEVLYARWSEDGLWYRAEVTDLLPETQSYLVVFVEYGNSQACTAADLAPLDTPVTAAAPVPLVQLDPETAEQQRQTRILERQQQLRSEEEARKAVLEEKRKQAAERRARAEALEKAEQLQRIEEQRIKLEMQQKRQLDALAYAPVVAGAKVVNPPPSTPVAASAPVSDTSAAVTFKVPEPKTPAPAPEPVPVKQSDQRPQPQQQQQEPAFKVPEPKTPAGAEPVIKHQQHSAPAQRTPNDPRSLDKRLTLSVAGGSGAKLGLMNGITLQELKQVALTSPRGEETPKKHPLDMTVAEARAARALDFGDTPKKTNSSAEPAKERAPSTPATKVSVGAEPSTPVADASTPMRPVEKPAAMKVLVAAKNKNDDDDDELDEEEEDSEEVSKSKGKLRGSMIRPTRPIPPPNVATAIGVEKQVPVTTSAVSSFAREIPSKSAPAATVISTPTKPSTVATPVSATNVVAPAPAIKTVLAESSERRSVRQPLPPVLVEDGNDSLVAREALHEFSVAASTGEDTVTTTQILNDLEDSLDSDLAELDELRAEANEVDHSISLFHQLREETNRLERTANAFADDLGDLEEEARLLLGE